MITTLTPIDELRLAAQALRDHAHAATEGPWQRHPRAGGVWRPGEERGRAPALVISGGASHIPDAEYIASMHPGIGLLIADLLDAIADDEPSVGEHDGFDPHTTITGYTQALALTRGYLTTGQETQ